MQQPDRTVDDLTVGDVLRMLVANERAAALVLNMVPSENAMSGLAKLPMLTDAYHRYFFNETGHPDRWHFRGGQGLRDLEVGLTAPLLAQLGKADHVSVRPLSGLSAMSLVLASLGGPPGSTVMTISPDIGGHYATRSIAARMGLTVGYLRGPDPHGLDLRHAAEVLAETRPALVYVDQSHCLFPIDIPSLVRTVRAASPGTLVHVDASHWFGLVLGGVYANPLDCGADSFGGSTHKTFPGPQKAVFLTRDPVVAERIAETQDYLISSHHFASTISLGIALLEFRDFGGARYARAVVDNTRRFGSLLHERGIPVVAADRGCSAGHQLWLDTAAEGIEPKLASDRLFDAGIRVNFMTGLPGFSGPGVRVGLNEPTYRGITEGDLTELADIFTAAIRATAVPRELAARVAQLRRQPGYGFPVGPASPVLHEALSLCATVLTTGHDSSGTVAQSPSVSEHDCEQVSRL
jgi:glycine/serine hydroxymethyltransferase